MQHLWGARWGVLTGRSGAGPKAALEHVQSLKKDIMGRLESIEPHTVARRLHMSTVSPGGSPRAWSEASGRGAGGGGADLGGGAGGEAPPGNFAYSEPLVAVLKDEVRKLGLRLEHSLQQSRQMEVRAREQVQRQGDEIEALKLENSTLRRSCNEADQRTREQLRAEREADGRLTEVVHRHVKATQAALSSAEPSCVKWVDMERDLPRALVNLEKQVREMCRLYAAQRGQYAGLISDAAAAREQVTRQVEHSDRKLLMEMERWRTEANTAREALDRLQAEHLELQAEYALSSSWAQAPPAPAADSGAEVEALRSSLRALQVAYADKDRDLGQLQSELAAARAAAPSPGAPSAGPPPSQEELSRDRAALVVAEDLGPDSTKTGSAASTQPEPTVPPPRAPAAPPAPAAVEERTSGGGHEAETPPEAAYWQSDADSLGSGDEGDSGKRPEATEVGEAGEALDISNTVNRDSVFSDGSDWSHDSRSDDNAAQSSQAAGSTFSFTQALSTPAAPAAAPAAPTPPAPSAPPVPPAPPMPPSPTQPPARPAAPAPPVLPSRPAPQPPNRPAPQPPAATPNPARSSETIIAEAERRASNAAPPPPVPQHLSAAGDALRRMSGADKPAGPPSAMRRAVEASKKRENKRISFAKMDAGGRNIKVNELPSGGKYKMSYSKDVYYVHPTAGFWREVTSGQFREVLSSELPKEIARRM